MATAPKASKTAAAPSVEPAAAAASTPVEAPKPAPASPLFEAIEEETDPKPFAKGKRSETGTYDIVEGHEAFPLVAPFLETYRVQKAARLATTDPDKIIAYFRRIATHEGKSVRIKVVTMDGELIKSINKEDIEANPALAGNHGKFNAILNGAKVRVRFQGVDYKPHTKVHDHSKNADTNADNS